MFYTFNLTDLTEIVEQFQKFLRSLHATHRPGEKSAILLTQIILCFFPYF